MGTELKEADCGTEAMQHNFTNEGGYNRRYRFLKTLWAVDDSSLYRKEIAEEVSFGTILRNGIEMQDFIHRGCK